MPGMNMMNHPHPDDQEAAMARADLYKMANYSFKLFKMIKDGDQLEGWVQAKITKSADYIASVFHYLEYEMKFSEYGNKIENADMYTEEVRQQYKAKLTEARVKMEKLKRKNQKDLEEGFPTVADAKARADKEKTTGKFDKKEIKPGVTQYTRKSSTFDDGGKDSDTKKAEKKTKGVKENMSPPDGATAPPPKGKDGQYPLVTSGPHKGKRWSPQTPGPTNPTFKEGSEKFDPLKHVKNPTKGEKTAAKDVKRGSYADRAAMLKSAEKDGRLKEADDKCNHTAKGKSCPVHGLKECGTMSEGFPTVADAKARAEKEKTTGKFDKKQTSTGTQYTRKSSTFTDGGDDKDTKNAKKTGKIKEGSKPDFLDMDKDGNKKEPMKKAVADKKAGPKKGVNPFAKK